MTKGKHMNILIDGPSRSGKLLLAKLLLASPKLAFQHYSGDLERILEIIYMSKDDRLICERLTELLRINIVHTVEDLKNARQVSININDSSYYKKTRFYSKFKDDIEKGNTAEAINSYAKGFIMHTHESYLFLKQLRKDINIAKIFEELLQNRYQYFEPAAQSLSGIREYTNTWNNKDKLTPFILYKSKNDLKKLTALGINNYPWYVDKSLSHYLTTKAIKESEIKEINKHEIIILSVCYITQLYLDSFRELNSNMLESQDRYFVFHENLHDRPSTDIKYILDSISLEFEQNTLDLLSTKETNAGIFGRSSIRLSFDKAMALISLTSIKKILEETNVEYCCIMNRQ